MSAVGSVGGAGGASMGAMGGIGGAGGVTAIVSGAAPMSISPPGGAGQGVGSGPSTVVHLSATGRAASLVDSAGARGDPGLGEVAHQGGGLYSATGLSEALGLGSPSGFSNSLSLAQSALAVGTSGDAKCNVSGQSYAELNAMSPELAALLLLLLLQEKQRVAGPPPSLGLTINVYA